MTRDEQIEQRYRLGLSTHRLAEIYGISRQRIHQILRARGVPTRPLVTRGIPELVADVVVRYTGGETLDAIARSIGVPHAGGVRDLLDRAGVRRRRRGVPAQRKPSEQRGCRIVYRRKVHRRARCLLPAERRTEPWLDEGVRQPWTSELPQIAIIGAPARAANGQ